jgi:hypothetical protein
LRRRFEDCSRKRIREGKQAEEENFQLIVGQAVTQQANDKEQLEPMVQVHPGAGGAEARGSFGGQWLLFARQSELSGTAAH